MARTTGLDDTQLAHSARHTRAFPGYAPCMEAMAGRTRWTDERLDDLKQSVDEVKQSLDRLQHAMVIAVVAMCTVMFAGFGSLITLFAIHF